LLSCDLLSFASQRERRGKVVQFKASRLLVRRDFHKFMHLVTHGLEVDLFRLRLVNRLFGQLGWQTPCFGSISSRRDLQLHLKVCEYLPKRVQPEFPKLAMPQPPAGLDDATILEYMNVDESSLQEIRKS
jgi:hypothetical protein